MIGISFENNVENNAIVPRVGLVPVGKPFCRVSVDLDVACIRRGTDFYTGVFKIGPPPEVEIPDIENFQRFSFARPEPGLIEVLMTPDVAEKAFVNILRAIRHDDPVFELKSDNRVL